MEGAALRQLRQQLPLQVPGCCDVFVSVGAAAFICSVALLLPQKVSPADVSCISTVIVKCPLG